jgi:hypothetical protein
MRRASDVRVSIARSKKREAGGGKQEETGDRRQEAGGRKHPEHFPFLIFRFTGHWSLVIGHWSFVIGQSSSGTNKLDSAELNGMFSSMTIENQMTNDK